MLTRAFATIVVVLTLSACPRPSDDDGSDDAADEETGKAEKAKP